MKRHSKLLSGLLVSGALWAAEIPGPRLQAPVLGYVFDDTAKAIRTVFGVPGAASLGEAIALPSTLSAARVHSGARLALGVTKEGQIVLASWNSVSRVFLLDSEVETPEQVAFSGSGERVAFSGGSMLEIWSTSGTPALIQRYHAAETLTGLTVNDSGAAVGLLASGRLARFFDNEEQPFGAGSEWSAVAYTSDGSAVMAADARRGELVRLTADGGRSVIAPLTGLVSAIASSIDGEYAATASGLQRVSGSGEVTAVLCECQAKGFDSVAGGAAVHIRGTDLVLDVDGKELRLTVLPNLSSTGAMGANQ
jgi:hypothetical protein